MIGIKTKSILYEIKLLYISYKTCLNTPYQDSTITYYITRLCDCTSTFQLNNLETIKIIVGKINKLKSRKQTCNAIKW